MNTNTGSPAARLVAELIAERDALVAELQRLETERQAAVAALAETWNGEGAAHENEAVRLAARLEAGKLRLETLERRIAQAEGAAGVEALKRDHAALFAASRDAQPLYERVKALREELRQAEREFEAAQRARQAEDLRLTRAGRALVEAGHLAEHEHMKLKQTYRPLPSPDHPHRTELLQQRAEAGLLPAGVTLKKLGVPERGEEEAHERA